MTTAIDDLKDEIAIEEVISYLGGEIIGNGWNDWSKTRCPFCGDTNGSASTNRILGRFLCHQCGAPRDGKSGDILDVAMLELHTTDTRDAIAWLKKTFGR